MSISSAVAFEWIAPVAVGATADEPAIRRRSASW
jgi:hypothetical protein